MPMDKMALSCDWQTQSTEAGSTQAAWGGEDNRVFVYGKSAGKGFSQTKILSEADNFVNCVRYSADGNFLATASSDKGVRVYDSSKGTVEFLKLLGSTKVRHKGSVYSCSWSPDGSNLLTASADKTCKIWNMEERKIRRTIPFGTKREDMVNAAAFIGNDKYVAITLGGIMYIGDPSVKDLPAPVHGHSEAVVTAKFDSKSGRMFTADDTGKVLVWSSSGEGKLVSWEAIAMTGVRPSDKYLNCGDACNGYWATGSNDNCVVIGTMDPPEGVASVNVGRMPPRKVCVHPENEAEAVCITRDEIICVDGKEIKAQVKVDEPKCLCIGKSGLIYAGLENGEVVQASYDGSSLKITARSEPIKHGHPTCIAQVSDDTIAVGTSERDITLLKVDDLSVVLSRKWTKHTSSVNEIVVNPSTNHIVSVGSDGSLCVWKEGSNAVVLEKMRIMSDPITATTLVGSDQAWCVAGGIVQAVDLDGVLSV